MAANKEDVSNVVNLETKLQREKNRSDYLKNLVTEAKYLHSLGFAPVPLVFRDKNAITKWKFENVVGKNTEWAKANPKKEPTREDYADVLLQEVIKKAETGRSMNLGVFPGRDYADIDLDTPLARELAEGILPPTGWMFGRETAGTEPTHYVYKVTGDARPGFRDFIPVEYRTKYNQLTVFPPSSHKQKEEEGGRKSWVKWVTPIKKAKPGIVDAKSLYEDVRVLAICHYLCADGVLYKGIFHNTARCISGGFRKMGLPIEKALNAMETIAGYTGQDAKKRLKQVRETYDKKEGERLDGWGSLAEFIGKGVVDEIFRVTETTASEDFGHPDGLDETSEAQMEGIELLRLLKEKCYLYVDDKYSYVIDTNERNPKRAKIKLSGFKDKYSYGKIPSADGKKLIKVTEAWLSDDQPKLIADEDYRPGEGVVFEAESQYFYNTCYLPPRKENTGTDKIQIFFDHLKYMFPESGDRELFLDVMAFWIQEPELRMAWVPLIVSDDHGVGKSVIEDIMVRLIGRDNCGAAGIRDLTDDSKQFNEFMYDTQFCCVHEVREGSRGKFQMTERLKHIITEAHQQVNKKGGFKGIRRVYTNLLFLSNHIDALAIDAADRRIWAHHITWGLAEKEHYTELWDMVRGDNVAFDQLWTWLMNRDLGLFDPGAAPPMTAAKEAMIESNQCIEERLLREAISEGAEGIEVATFQQIMRLAETYNESDRSLSNKTMLQILKHNSEFKQVGKGRINVGRDGKYTPWILTNNEHWNQAVLDTPTKARIREMFIENESKLPASGAVDF